MNRFPTLIPRTRGRLGLLCGLAAALLLPACGTLSYYAQSVTGHLRLMAGREPVASILADPDSDAELRRRLETAQRIRDYASRVLALPDNGSYRSYVDVGRPFLIWSVFATPEFSLKPKRWCFPLAGCVSYRGYFSKADAEAFAEGLRAQGLDVYVGGVPAYSTLGWFDDPLINTMLRYNDTRLAELIFHELAHQEVYVPDDTAFNEAFAVALAESGVQRWLEDTRPPEAQEAYEQARSRTLEFLVLVERTRRRLKAIYRSGDSRGEMRAAKRMAIDTMRAGYKRLKADWGGYRGYDVWFAGPVNNAQLAAVAIYRDLVPAFTRLLADCGGDYRRFYEAVAELAVLPRAERRAALKQDNGCA